MACGPHMKDQIPAIEADALARISAATDERALEDARVAVLGKKGSLTLAAAGMKDVPKEEKGAVGQLLNAARASITAALEAKQSALQEIADRAALAGIDTTLPARELPIGGLHPLTLIRDEAIAILRRMGFALADGPEIEDEFHCFDALNTPADHPARNEKDTFYFDSGKLLRTHTSSVQIRTMESAKPPIRISHPARRTAATKSTPPTSRSSINSKASMLRVMFRSQISRARWSISFRNFSDLTPRCASARTFSHSPNRVLKLM